MNEEERQEETYHNELFVSFLSLTFHLQRRHKGAHTHLRTSQSKTLFISSTGLQISESIVTWCPEKK